ncbi:MAG: sensor histidine kinase [Candidatus Limnocylindrales bacterium]
MSPELVAIGVAGILLGLAAGLMISREVTLERIREIIGATRGEPLEAQVRALVDRQAQTEQQVRLAAEDLAFLAGLVGSGIVRLDDELVVTSANRAAHVYLDLPQGGLVGRQVPDRPIPHRDGAPSDGAVGLGDVRLNAVARTAWRNGAAADEVSVGGPEGRVLAVRARRSPSEGIWIVLEDLSELRRLQRIRTEFIDNLSHELRTPLTTVRLLTETLARDLEETDVPARVVDVVEKIDVETGHLVQMATELLDLAKIEQGFGPQLYIDDVDLAPIVASVLDRLGLFAERQGVRLRAEIDPAAPPVLGDAERLSQLLINLVHNAIKFSSSGGDVTVRVRPEHRAGTGTGAGAGDGAGTGDGATPASGVPVTSPPARATGAPPLAAPGSVVLEVEDHGVGIPAEDVSRVFERFYKVDKARVRGAGGTGLGLAIVRHIAEDHGGSVSVESVEGAGSTFRVTLPAAPPVPSATARGTG